jgi:hypothetical protein
MNCIVLSKSLLNYWHTNSIPVTSRCQFLCYLKLSPYSIKSNEKLSFRADCAYTWEKDSKCLAMKWDAFYKSHRDFDLITISNYLEWLDGKPININTNENRLQKQKVDVVRGDDTEGNRVQSRKCKVAVTVGHLSYKAVKI